MNKLFTVLWDWRFVIALCIILALFATFRYQQAKSVLYALMLQAKRYAKDLILKSGQEQEDWVVRKALQCLPLSLRLALDEDTVRTIVRWLYKNLKDYMDDGELNQSAG